MSGREVCRLRNGGLEAELGRRSASFAALPERYHRGMKTKLSALLLTLTLASCAHNRTWVKEGATQQDFAADTYECEKDARQSSYFGGGLVGALNMQSFEARCMVAHGYSMHDSDDDNSTDTGPDKVIRPSDGIYTVASKKCLIKGLTPATPEFQNCYITEFQALKGS